MSGSAIRNAQSSYAVMFFLTTYLSNLQGRGELPPHLSALPLGGLHDVMARLDALVGELDNAFRGLDLQAIDAIAETVRVFDAAVHRLIELKQAERLGLAEELAA